MNINWSFCSGPEKLGVTIGQSDCYASHPWDSRRVARLDGWKAFAERVGSHVDGRGYFCSTTCCYSKRPTVRARAATGVQLQQGVNRVVLERMTQLGAKP